MDVAGARFIRALVYGVSATDPLTFVAVPVLVVAVAVLAALVPAHRAAGLDPAIVLRME